MFDFLSDPKFLSQLEILKVTYLDATWETVYSLCLQAVFAYLIGLPLGVLLVTGEANGIHPLPRPLMKALNVIINLLRSVPFLILMIIALPLSKLIVGTKIGTNATIPPMVIAAFPLVARMVESSVREVDRGVVEAAQSMGASTWQIVTKVLLPEAMPSLIGGGAITMTTILGYGAMAGIIGGGGLGKVAINYGYYRYNYPVMIIAVILLIVIVQIFQTLGTHLSVRCDKRITTKHKRRKNK